MAKPFALACALLVSLARVPAQIVTGTVVDEGGTPVPYVTVAEESRALGVTTSPEGRYRIDLGGEGGTLTVRYVGYEVVRREVPAGGDAEVALDIVLPAATYELPAAEVGADAEDPAYRIMREAAARREGYLTEAGPHEVDVYVKGFFALDDAPEKIFGQELGDMGGLLDSSRAGILYLSETYSELAVDPPDRARETVVASKVSGAPQAYSFNTAVGIDFELYRRVTTFGKPLLSPLAETAPQTYRFELLGSRRGSDNALVHRIGVRPRRVGAPAYHGEVYVEEGSFHLIDADLYVLGGPLASPGLDTLFIAQAYRQRAGRWEVYQRRVEPVLSLFSFRIRGAFTAVYTDYDYAPDWGEDSFGRVRSRVLPEANAVDSALWANRPIPLTPPERRDYLRKDSIRRVRESPAYRDSVEAADNRVDWGVIGGYAWSDWRRRSEWRVTSPLMDFAYHPVTGWLLGLGVGYTRDLDEARGNRLDLGAGVRYGLADERWYPHAKLSYRFDEQDAQTVTLRAARELRDLHRAEPVGWLWNTNYNLFVRDNPLKLYERDVVELSHRGVLRRPGSRGLEPPSGVTFSHALRRERRRVRANATELRGLFNRGEPLESNLPLGGEVGPGLEPTALYYYDGQLDYTPGQRYLVRPDGYTALPSPWPTFTLGVRTSLGNDVSVNRSGFAFAYAALRRDDWRVGRLGLLSARARVDLRVDGGGELALIDRHLFAGNPVPVNAFGDYLARYLALDPYRYATSGHSGEAAAEYDFDGVLWRNLPLLRRLRWEVVARGALLYVPREGSTYEEVGVALENIGFGLARFVRVDVAWARNDGAWSRPRVILGLNIPVGAMLEGAADGDTELDLGG